MKSLIFLSIFGLVGYGVINASAAVAIPKIIPNIFRAEDKVFITNLKPNTKIEIYLQRITFRKLVADICGEISFESSTVPTLVLIEDQEFIPAKFPLEASRICTKRSAKSDRSYKTTSTNFFLAGLKPQQPHLVQIIKSARKNLETNRCGYGSIPITKSLTAFSSSYADNIYSINGKKLKDLKSQNPPKCKKK
jgi:hypothetical protein